MPSFEVKDDAHWHALRAVNVGGSEVAALFGEHPQLTQFELWHRKNGNLPEPDLSDNERIFWGQVLEPAIAAGVAKKTGWTVRKVRRYLTHPTVEGWGSSLDYEIVSHDDGPGVLEIKTADWLVAKRWDDGEPPLNYELQTQSYMGVTGRAWGAIAVLVGGNDLRLFTYRRRDRTIALIERAVADFWRSIRENDPPKPDFLADADAISALHQSVVAGKVLDLSSNNRLPELIAAYQEGAALAKEGDEAKKAAKSEILEIIGDAEVVLCGDAKITAGQVAGAHIEFDRAPYRGFRVTEKKAASAAKAPKRSAPRSPVDLMNAPIPI